MYVCACIGFKMSLYIYPHSQLGTHKEGFDIIPSSIQEILVDSVFIFMIIAKSI